MKLRLKTNSLLLGLISGLLLIFTSSVCAQEVEDGTTIMLNANQQIIEAETLETNDFTNDTPSIKLESYAVSVSIGQDVTADDLLEGVSVVDSDGNVLDNMLDEILFDFNPDSYSADDYMTVEEAVDYINASDEKKNSENIKYKIGLVFGEAYPEYQGYSRWSYVTLKFNTDVYYATHVENVGWQDYVSDGEISGTFGLSLRLEGIKIYTNNPNLQINYETHIQNIGWESDTDSGIKSDNEMSGTTGQGLRLEAVSITLSGADADKYDVVYAVHAQNFGDLGWAKNGEYAGTAGYGYRLEAISIKIIAKDSMIDRSGKAPFVNKSDNEGFGEQVIALINNARAEKGLQPLATSAKLTQAAQVRSKEISLQFSTTRPDGRYFTSVLSDYGIGFNFVYEPRFYIFYFENADQFFEELIGTIPETVYSDAYDQIGVAVYQNGDVVKYVDILCVEN